MSINQNENLKVKKPWGSEYIVYQNKDVAVWLLTIEPGKSTSLHCHPKKKTGFILLSGEAQVDLGFYDKKNLTSPSKLMIRPGLFHSTKALSKNDISILEIETPIDKNDLVRFKDSFGREEKPYEGKEHMSQLKKEDITFQDPKENQINTYRYKNVMVTLEKHSNAKNLSNRPSNTIFAVLDGGLISKDNKFVLSPGDIVRTDTITKLSEVFKTQKSITVLTVNKQE